MDESADEYDFVETEEGIITEKIVETPAEKRETTGEIIAFMSGNLDTMVRNIKPVWL